MRALASIVATAMLVSIACQSRIERQEADRCFEDLHLSELLAQVGYSQSGGWGVGSAAQSSRNRIFELHQATNELAPERPIELLSALCAQFFEQVAARCDVVESWAGRDYCAAKVESPEARVTDEDGFYIYRPVRGQANLFLSFGDDGKTQLVLTASEWAS